MIGTKIAYAILLVILVLFFILYRGTLSLQLLLLGILLPLLLRILLWVQYLAFRVSLLSPKTAVQKGDLFAWKLRLQNPTWIPGARAAVYAEYENKLIGTPQKLRMEVQVPVHGSEQITLRFRAETCGIMRMKVQKIVLYDPLKLWHSTVRVRTEKQTAVLPAMPLPPDWRPGAVPTDEDPEYSKVKPGDDPSEIFDFHSYREGDPIARIHWKLSSKHDELMVKEFSLPLPGKVLCLPDYRLCGGFPESAQRLDAMLSLLRAVALMLTESGSQTPGMLCSLHDTEPTDVQSEADLNDWLCALLSVTPARASKKSDPVQDIVQPVADRLRNTRNADRLLVFLPAADPALLAALAALEAPERLTVFTVFCSGEEEAQLRAVDCPFELVTVSAEAQPPAEQAQPETAQPKKRGGAVLP